MTAIGRLAAPITRPLPGLRRFATPLACLAVACFAGWFSVTVSIGNVDVSWLLIAGERLLDGARLHVDIVEINPPLSIGLYMPFLLAERGTGLRAELWLAFGLPAFALFSVWLFARILHQGGIVNGARPWFLPAVLVALICLAPRDFAQREQFAVIALLPWLALLASRDRNPDFAAGTRLQRVLAGLGAAVFVMIKPPLAVFALVLPVLYLCVRRRSIRPLFTIETLLGVTVTVSYLAWLASFHQLFFTDILSMVRELYLPMRMSVSAMLALWPVMTFVAIAGAIFVAAWPSRIDRLAMLLLLAGTGYLPSFVLLGKGWTYQALPSLTLGVLALFVQLSRPRGETASTPLAKTGAAVGLLLVAQLLVSEMAVARNGRASVDSAAAAIGGVILRPTVASIATRLQPAHPLTRVVGGRYVSRYPSLWWSDNAASLIATAADTGRRRRLEELRDRLITDSARNLAAVRPDIIIDGGSRPTLGQQNVHDDPLIAQTLESYRVLYRDADATVWLRSDIAPLSSASEATPAQ